MNRYSKLAGIGFATGLIAAGLFLSTVTVVPWEQQRFELMGGYFSFCCAYVMCLPIILKDIHLRHNIWANPRKRYIGVLLLGASIGLHVLGWISILYPSGLENRKTNDFARLLCGAGTEPLLTQARELVAQAELLVTCKMLIDNCMLYTAGFAALAMFSIWVHDTWWRPKNIQ